MRTLEEIKALLPDCNCGNSEGIKILLQEFTLRDAAIVDLEKIVKQKNEGMTLMSNILEEVMAHADDEKYLEKLHARVQKQIAAFKLKIVRGEVK